MTPIEQRMEWAALVNWVIWLHDQFELSREERLPLCWTRHPGLVEELRSLKAWRETIYDTPEAIGAPHTIRSWHGELRQTITAAMTFWAKGCRAGHRGGEPLSTAYPDLANQWRETPPPVAPTGMPLRQSIDHPDLTALVQAGAAHRPDPVFGTAVSFAGTWWEQRRDRQPWTRVVDPTHHANLDDAQTRLSKADEATTTLNRP
jgi:hypothetical protein